MKNTKRLSPWVVVVLILSPLFSIHAAEEQAKWQKKMQELAKTLGDLLPELVSKNPDTDVIKAKAKKLSELSHSLKPGLMTGKAAPANDADPTLGIIAERFSEEAKSAYSAIQAGNIEYGKNRLSALTGYCITCHTRHDKGPEFPTFALNPNTEKLSAEEKAQLYVATRQFDRGLEAYESLIQDKEFAQKRPFEWDRAVRNAIAISVRAKNDPQRAIQILDQALNAGALEYKRANYKKWKQALQSWKKETVTKAATDKELVKEMRRLMQNAKNAQLFPMDQVSEIQFLRAERVAHDLLRNTKDPKTKAEALLTIGIIAEVLNNAFLWPVQERYYEQCVREFPHSEVAMQCYGKFEESIYLGYTGSAGTSIPDDVRSVLAEVKALAKTK